MNPNETNPESNPPYRGITPANPQLPTTPGDRLGIPEGTSRSFWDPSAPRPSYTFLVVVTVLSFAADIGSKLWAERRLRAESMELIPGHLNFVLAKNFGGAWGLLHNTAENVRRPFFLLVSVAAIAFIMTLYQRLHPRQHALKWGLPLVLGGALGNVYDRIRQGYVVDFIDYHAHWIEKMNEMLKRANVIRDVTDHWPTFNVADIAICIGVGLMAIDMFSSKRSHYSPPSRRRPSAQAGELAANPSDPS